MKWDKKRLLPRKNPRKKKNKHTKRHVFFALVYFYGRIGARIDVPGVQMLFAVIDMHKVKGGSGAWAAARTNGLFANV